MRFLTTVLYCCFPLAAFTQTPVEEPIQYATLSSGVRLAYTEQGKDRQGPVLLFVHGLGSNLKSWRKNLNALSPKARCIAVDLPGYGDSGKGDYAYNMTFFAEALRDFLQIMGIPKVILVGHSMGGQIAVHLALAHPGIVEKAVLLAPAGFETFSEKDRAWFAAIMTPDILKATPPAQIRKNFEINFYHFPEDAEFMIADRMGLRDRTADYEAYCQMIPKCVKGMLEQPVFDRLPDLKLPILVLYGEQDYLIPNRYLHPGKTTLEVAQTGRSQLPNAHLQMIPAAGHFVQWEGATMVNEAIKTFMDK